jgi:prepilin-type N-terminal cleavage/methylation domain-containing protein
MNHSPIRPSARSGFTLVELLVVIVIIGMLAALITAAAVRAVGAAKRTQITLDLDQFETSMESTRDNDAGSFPPDLSYPPPTVVNGNTIASFTLRQNRIMAHLRSRFARAIFLDQSNTTANGYGPVTNAITSAPGSLQAATQNWFQSLPALPQPKTPSGDVWGNADNLDPAEALVFWLGGMPVPAIDPGTGKWLFKMAGFNANKQRPFDVGGSRAPGPYEFVTSRLGDADGDGWPEYYPPNAAVPQPPGSTFQVGNPVPPYVYFDAVSYTAISPYDSTGATGWSTYPSPYPMTPTSNPNAAGYNNGNNTLQPTAYISQWGLAVPYASLIQTTSGTTGLVTWVNDSKFQVVSAGLDMVYCSQDAISSGFRRNFPLFPSPLVTSNLPNGAFTLDYNDPLDPNVQRYGEQDNLANFTSGTLQDGSQQ